MGQQLGPKSFFPWYTWSSPPRAPQFHGNLCAALENLHLERRRSKFEEARLMMAPTSALAVSELWLVTHTIVLQFPGIHSK